MTSQILITELSNIVQESKRKHSELKNAAEKSLQDIKGLPTTSEVQLAAGTNYLSRRPYFINPFLIACSTQNAKFASPAVVSLHRLAVSHALPRERLKSVLEALRESSGLGVDIQIKILQVLPILVQTYPTELRRDLLYNVLQICSILQGSKAPAISNTAAATLQQLVIAVFDRVVEEDERSLELPTVGEVPDEDGTVQVRAGAYDAFHIFRDVCILIEGGKAQAVRLSNISQSSGLELIESILTNHGDVFSSHPEQANILRSILMPFIIRSISERSNFPVTVRIMRVLNILIRHHLSTMPAECEMALGLLNHMLDPDAATPWKRALCMEIFRGIYTEPGLVLEIYHGFDEMEGKKSILGDNLAAFVRLVIEKPAAIGLGQQSSAPATNYQLRDPSAEQVAVEAGATAGVIGGAVTSTSAQYTGLSSQWSTLRTPCIEQLDKLEPPSLPETYVHSLVMGCINSLSESMAKIILPLTVHSEVKTKKKSKSQPGADDEDVERSVSAHSTITRPRSTSYRRRNVPVNPLELEDHSMFGAVKIVSAIIMSGWPAVLATCSTFLNATLDADYYRSLVRSIQKFTQVSGLLRLGTSRDAFLTTLSKSAVPPNILTANLMPSTPQPLESPKLFSNAKGLLSVDSLVGQASNISSDRHRRSSIDLTPSLGARNLLCLRALLNLAIALGPTLDKAWTIVLETLQKADIVLAVTAGKVGHKIDDTGSTQSINSEISAVKSAAIRMFESTVDYPNDAFIRILDSLSSLLHDKVSLPQRSNGSSTTTQQGQQKRMTSMSGISLNTAHSQDRVFVLSKIGELGSLNLDRLIYYEPSESGWNVLFQELTIAAALPEASNTSRLLSSDIISKIVQETAKASMSLEEDQKNAVQKRLLSAINSSIGSLYRSESSVRKSLDEVTTEVHATILQALKSILEECGESITAGWNSVFGALLSVFEMYNQENIENDEGLTAGAVPQKRSSTVISLKLCRSAFGSLQLVCSDFLQSIPDSCFSTLLEILFHFSSQENDLNISLTTITFFWNVSDFLHGRIEAVSITELSKVIDGKTDVLNDLISVTRQGSISALWCLLLFRLAAVTADPRAEVRNGAVQTILRIFDNYGQQLSSEAWTLCINLVVFKMVNANIKEQDRIRKIDSTSTDNIKSWNETTKVLFDGISHLFAIYFEPIIRAPSFTNIWSNLMDAFKSYLDLQSNRINAIVYATMGNMLSRIEDPSHIAQDSLCQITDIWMLGPPIVTAYKQAMSNNQEALETYMRTYKEIYRLNENKTTLDDISKVTGYMKECVEKSDSHTYSSDVDHLTSLQAQVMECLGIIRTDFSGVPGKILMLLSDFIAVPYENDVLEPSKKNRTFISLSKASMTMAQTISIKHINDSELYTSGAFQTILESLKRAINLKYKWRTEGKAPSPWQKATSVSLAILDPALTTIQTLSLPDMITRDIWTRTIEISTGIISADLSPLPPTHPISSDESFDLTSFTALRNLLIPSLGAAAIPDQTRRAYTSALFTNSLIHRAMPGEIPPPGASPLRDLYAVRLSRTSDPAPTSRTRMAYLCLSELLSLVAAHDSSPACVRLAQAAAPYFILRAALPIKAYIADQPLRGRMPQPESQREELLFVLRRLGELEVEPLAIPEVEGVRGAGRKHLHRLFPLLGKAVTVARRDEEVLGELVKLVEVVGEGFGVE
ncbi:endosomal peripheral membrane protein-like protein [Patellaria atrata CBS 101060]|uniref:Endosomal peripheral membrane protein-like protein n=1 Tax=Patellaria atrata CBS 101060 TaxID=1346257 RepID=A0A9P4SIU2_9PEZI|nr:endosomal peripheral membrane protein-like protein [Patellaria atrata CBS 101060]